MKKNQSENTETLLVKAGEPEKGKDLMAALQAASEAAKGKLKVLIGADETFNFPVIYTYCDYESYKNLYKRILNKNPPNVPAKANCTFGCLNVESDGVNEWPSVLVWINSTTPFELTLPSFFHEIVHVATGILEHTGVEDKNGEMLPCIVERETRRVLTELFHLPIPSNQGLRDKVLGTIRPLLDNFPSTKAEMPPAKTDTPGGVKDLKAAVSATADADGGNGKIVIGYDETFRSPIVYSYGSFASLKKLCRLLLDNKEIAVPPASVYCTFERIGREIDMTYDTRIGLVWVNNTTPFEESLPKFINGIAGLVLEMLEYANIEDPNGEALANIVERESRRVLAELFNLPIPTNPADEVKKALAPFLTSDSGKSKPKWKKSGTCLFNL